MVGVGYRQGVQSSHRAAAINASIWTPLDLGSLLIAWWDSAYGISLSGNQVTAWADRKNGYSAVQGFGASRPVYSSNGFNGAPGLTFDGTDDELTCTDAALLAALPAGSNPSELWEVVQQDTPGTDATVRHIFAYGGADSTTRRVLTRGQQTTNLNRFHVQFGDGAANRVTLAVAADFSSRHVVRGKFEANGASAFLDGLAGTKTSAVPATTATRLRIGCGSGTTANLFHLGKIRDAIVIGGLLSTEQAALMQNFLSARRML